MKHSFVVGLHKTSEILQSVSPHVQRSEVRQQAGLGANCLWSFVFYRLGGVIFSTAPSVSTQLSLGYMAHCPPPPTNTEPERRCAAPVRPLASPPGSAGRDGRLRSFPRLG